MIMKQKRCEYCNAAMIRKRYNGRLEDNAVFRRRRFCDHHCAAAFQQKHKPSLPHALKDSPTESAYHKRAEKHKKESCERCGITTNLAVHHCDLDPTNNNPSNLMTLCGSCHTKWHWEHGKTQPRKAGVL